MIKGIAFDFDEVLVETIKSAVLILNEDYNMNINPIDIKKWDFSDMYPSISTDKLKTIWEDDRLFEGLEFKPDTFNVLKELFDKYDLCIVTLGTRKNLSLKYDWIVKNIIDKGIKINFFGVIEDEEDKSIVDLNEYIFIDDNEDNLNVSNASVKILFKNRDNADWNSNWNGDTIINLKEIYQYIQ